jgi:hypothetical protein
MRWLRRRLRQASSSSVAFATGIQPFGLQGVRLFLLLSESIRMSCSRYGRVFHGTDVPLLLRFAPPAVKTLRHKHASEWRGQSKARVGGEVSRISINLPAADSTPPGRRTEHQIHHSAYKTVRYEGQSSLSDDCRVLERRLFPYHSPPRALFVDAQPYPQPSRPS